MGIVDKAKAAMAGDAVQAAFKEQEKRQKDLSALSQRRIELASELREASAPLGALSLDESAEGRKKYDAALAKVEALERELRRNGDAQAETRAKLQAINANIIELTQAERIRTLTRIGKERQAKAEALQDKMIAFVHEYQSFRNGTEKLISAFPEAASDIGLSLDMVPAAIAVELYRLWPVGPGHRNAASAVPGAHSGLGLDDPRAIPTLAETVRQQSEAALSRFKASVMPAVEAEQPVALAKAAEAIMAETPHPFVKAEPASGKTINAADVPITTVMLDGKNGRVK
jgi:hypothetical protein